MIRQRFGGDAARASAFVGLVPSRRQLGGAAAQRPHYQDRARRSSRALLVQASWVIWRGRSAAGAELRTWAQPLAARRGRRIAIVALARRLTRILYAMWRDQTDFTPRRRGRHRRVADHQRRGEAEPTAGAGARSVSWPHVRAVTKMAPRPPASHDARRLDSRSTRQRE